MINQDELEEDYENYPDEPEKSGSVLTCYGSSKCDIKGLQVMGMCEHCNHEVSLGIEEIRNKKLPIRINKDGHELYIGTTSISTKCPCHNYERITSNIQAKMLQRFLTHKKITSRLYDKICQEIWVEDKGGK